jgi:hypothetical protein
MLFQQTAANLAGELGEAEMISWCIGRSFRNWSTPFR